MQPGPRTQAALLIGAGVLMVLFALDMFGVKAVRRFVPRPPASWGRRVRRSARSTTVTTPAVLGFRTVLIPCGVTLSVELIAVTSGSALTGAAVLAGFVLGTGPLFAVLGFFLRSAAKLWQGRLTLVTATNNTGGCIRAFVIPDLGIQKILPTTGTATIDLGNRKPGRLDYTCGMGMYAGQITFQQPAVQGPQTTAIQETTL
ncbi:sulfite exporter TauE/SafE family protein [Streptomyces sp. NBC_01443]|nr:sulfite exporter TauE/SafE family protein [Streptomyces sp. NBC_01443]